MSTSDDVILTERIGEHLVVIRINRPARRNAFDGATARAMEAAIDTFEDDDSLRCAIITGSDIVFSAGPGPHRRGIERHGRRAEARWLRDHGDAADEAGDRGDRRSRARRRPRARAVVRPHRGFAHREHGHPGSGAVARRGRRWPLPAPEAHPVPPRDGARPHGQALAGNAHGRARSRQPARRAGSGVRRSRSSWRTRCSKPARSR